MDSKLLGLARRELALRALDEPSRSVLGAGPVLLVTLISDLPELGHLSDGRAGGAALAAAKAQKVCKKEGSELAISDTAKVVDEAGDGDFMHVVRLGKGKGLAGKASHLLPEGAVPTLHWVSLGHGEPPNLNSNRNTVRRCNSTSTVASLLKT